MKKSTIFILSVLIMSVAAMGFLEEMERDSFSFEIPIIKEVSLKAFYIVPCRFSKDSNRILLICTPSQKDQSEFVTSQNYVFDVESGQLKDLKEYQTTRYANGVHFDPNLEYSVWMLRDLQNDDFQPGFNFVNQQPPLGSRQHQPGYNFSDPQQKPEIPVRPFKIVNLWRDTEITLIRDANKDPADFFEVRFDHLKNDIWLYDKEPGIGHRYGYWQLYDISGKPLQKYPNGLNDINSSNILSGTPITSPDSSFVAFLAGVHYELKHFGHEDNEVCFAMVCDRKTGVCLAGIPVDQSCLDFNIFSPYHTSRYILFAKDSQAVFVRDSRWQISLVDIRTQQILQIFNIREVIPNCRSDIRMKEVTSDGCLIIEAIPSNIFSSKEHDSQFYIWDAKSGNVLKTFNSSIDFEHRDRISPDGRTKLCLDRFETDVDEETNEKKGVKEKRQLTFRDTKTNKILATQEVPANGHIMPVELSPDWSKMVGYGKDELIVYDISSITNRP